MTPPYVWFLPVVFLPTEAVFQLGNTQAWGSLIIVNTLVFSGFSLQRVGFL